MVEKLDGCLKCGLPLPEAPTGRPAVYCGPGCRQAAFIELRRIKRLLDRFEDETIAIRRELVEEPYEKRGYGAKGKDYWGQKRRQLEFLESEIGRYEGRLQRLLSEGGASPQKLDDL